MLVSINVLKSRFITCFTRFNSPQYNDCGNRSRKKIHAIRNLTALVMFILPFLTNADILNPIGDEFMVNSHTTGSQERPSISPLINGGFVITWQSENQDGDGFGIYAQRYQADGSPNGAEFQVNSYTSNNQMFPAVSGLNNGGFIITWQSNGQDGDGDGIYAQRYHANGNSDGAEFQVNTYTTNNQSWPSPSRLNNGSFIITWQSKDQDGNDYGIYAQRYLENGVRDGEEFQVNSYTNYQIRSSISSLNNGGFIITWSSYQQDGSGHGIFAQRYQEDGVRDGEEFQVNSYTTGFQTESSVSGLSDGGFIIVWVSTNQDGDLGGIFAQRYKENGVPNGEEFQVNTYITKEQRLPSVSSLNNGGFIITWYSEEQDGSRNGIYAQRYLTDGNPNGEEFLVNSYTTSNQMFPSVNRLNNDGFIITWASLRDGDSFGIYAQRYQSDISNSIALLDLPVTLYSGAEFTVTVNVAGKTIYGIDGVLTSASPAIIQPLSSQYSEYFNANERMGLPSTVTESQWLGALTLQAPAEAKTGSGFFATINLKAGQAGTTNLTLVGQLTNQQGQLIYDNSHNYSVTVIEGLNIIGSVTTLGVSGDFQYVRVFINGQAVSINADGSFTIKTGPGEAIIRVEADGFLSAEKTVQLNEGQPDLDFGAVYLFSGDSNGDSRIDIADLTLLLGAYRSKYSDGAPYTPAADFNRDNQIDIQDLTLLGSHFGKEGIQTW